MVTSIQLKECTKESLFSIKNQLEGIFGRSLTYDEVIEYLIKTNQFQAPPKRLLKKYKGILGLEGRELFRKLRQEELIYEEK